MSENRHLSENRQILTSLINHKTLITRYLLLRHRLCLSFTMELSTMDRPISAHKLLKLKLQRIAFWSGAVVLVTLIFWGARKLIRPSLKQGQFETATVETGMVSESISCTGTVELENHQMILSPATAMLEKIRAYPGEMVQAGDTILKLDPRGLLKLLEQKNLDLKSLQNKLTQQEINASIARLEMQHQEDLKKVEIEKLKSVWKDEQAMLQLGGTPVEKVEQAQQAYELAQRELKITHQKNALQLDQQEAAQQNLALEQEKIKVQLDQLREQLNQLWVLAPIPGVIISVNAETGSMVPQDQELVRISDLRTFRINGKIADKFAQQLAPGGKVQVVVDSEHHLAGSIGNIRPLVESNQVHFEVTPEDKSHPRFRPNLELELRILVAEKRHTLRVKDGPFFDGSKKLKVFKLENSQAVAVEVTTGLSNMDYLEIESGLEPGDEIVISDVSAFQHLDQVEVK